DLERGLLFGRTEQLRIGVWHWHKTKGASLERPAPFASLGPWRSRLSPDRLLDLFPCDLVVLQSSVTVGPILLELDVRSLDLGMLGGNAAHLSHDGPLFLSPLRRPLHLLPPPEGPHRTLYVRQGSTAVNTAANRAPTLGIGPWDRQVCNLRGVQMPLCGL